MHMIIQMHIFKTIKVIDNGQMKKVTKKKSDIL